MSVLHLIDPGEVGGGPMTVRLLADLFQHRLVRDRVVVLGHRGHAQLAQAYGLPVDGLVSCAGGWHVGAARTAKRVMRQLGRGGGFELVMAWSQRAGALAGQILPGTPCVVYAAVGAPRSAPMSRRLQNAIGRMMSRRRGKVVYTAAHAGVAEELALAGVARESIVIATPGVDRARVQANRQPSRAALRAKWDVADSTLLVGLLSQPISWGNARAAASIVTLPVTANRDVRLLVHPDALRLREAQDWARPLKLDDALVQESDLAEPWRVFAGLDAALWLGGPRNAYVPGGALAYRGSLPMPGMQPILWAMAAGLPVVAGRCAASEIAIEDGVNGTLIGPGSIADGAEAMVHLHDDAAMRATLGESARQTIHERFTITHFAQRIDQACARALGEATSSQAKLGTRSPMSASAAPV